MNNDIPRMSIQETFRLHERLSSAKKSKRKESDLKKAILQYLKMKRCLAFLVPTVGIYDSKIGRRRKAPLKGIADIVGMTENGRFIAIEAKKKGGKNRPEQKLFLEEVRRHNGIGIIAYSIDDVIKAGL